MFRNDIVALGSLDDTVMHILAQRINPIWKHEWKTQHTSNVTGPTSLNLSGMLFIFYFFILKKTSTSNRRTICIMPKPGQYIIYYFSYIFSPFVAIEVKGKPQHFITKNTPMILPFVCSPISKVSHNPSRCDVDFET